MTWIINNEVILPFGGPQEVRRRLLRKQSAEAVIESFALPFDLGPDSFELNIKGLISPASEAQKLWQICEKAEQSSITITVENEPEFETFINNSLYAVNRADIGMSEPRFDADTGAIVQDYDITFVQFPGSDVQPTDSGELESDEAGVGFGSFDDFGSFIYSQIQGFLPNLLS
jgi:hypothetical protein